MVKMVQERRKLLKIFTILPLFAVDDPPGLLTALKSLEAAGGYGNPGELSRRIAAAEKAAEAHREKEAAEMLDKLKGLGNTILGKFGMSLDNFVSEKREDGTYNIQFKQG